MKHWAFSEKAHIDKIRNSWIEITEKYTFFLFPTVYIFDFCKNMSLNILFLVDKSLTQIMNMFWELLVAVIKCMIVFQELNCDPLKKIRSSCPEVFCKNGVLKNFTKFTEKHLCENLAQVFFCKFCEIFRNTIFYGTPLVAASEIYWRYGVTFIF